MVGVEVLEQELIAAMDLIALLIVGCALVKPEVHGVGQLEDGVHSQFWFRGIPQKNAAFIGESPEWTEARARLLGRGNAAFAQDGFAIAVQGETNCHVSARGTNHGTGVKDLGPRQVRDEVGGGAYGIRRVVAIMPILVVDGIGWNGYQRFCAERVAGSEHERDVEGAPEKPEQRTMFQVSGGVDGNGPDDGHRGEVTMVGSRGTSGRKAWRCTFVRTGSHRFAHAAMAAFHTH